MPTDGATRSSGGESPNEPTDARPDNHLVFAITDPRDRSDATAADEAELGFALAPRPATAPVAGAAESGTFVQVEAIPPERPPTSIDTFVISQGPVAASRPPADAIVGVPAFAIAAVDVDAGAVRLSVRAEESVAEALWLVREPSPASASPHGWSTRPGRAIDRSTHAAILRLREEAVHVSWQAAWLATTSSELKHRRGR